MYPFLRHLTGNLRARLQPTIGIWDESIVRLRVGFIDTDPWMELNNGRTLTLYDLGRIPHFRRTRITNGVDKAGMYFTVAGLSVRYRGRITPWSKIEIRTKISGWDARFMYVEQSMWQGGACVNGVLIRMAIARRGQGLVAPAEIATLLGLDPESKPLPDWIENWIAAEATRTWPPEVSH